ncbi:hypothetical protein HYW55_03205 [Candidatus Gottesmanbacteria bacterium]|nr:hypothetical protein [Candidatus Gottesmanbacteria bacterium]
MKILYIIRSIGFIAYHESIIEELSKRGHFVEILFDKKWSTKRNAYKNSKHALSWRNSSTGWLKRRDDLWRKILFPSRELLTYIYYCKQKSYPGFYLKRWEGYQPRILRFLFRLSLIKRYITSNFIERVLHSLEKSAPPDSQIMKELIGKKPHVVVASPVNMRYSEEVEYIKAANALNIPTVIAIHSWDNLTTKGLFHVRPGTFLAWNSIHKKELTQIHKVSSSLIKIMGAPLFDKWFTIGKKIQTRKQFFGKLGIKEGQQYIIYLGSSANIAFDETWLVKNLAREIAKSPNQEIRNLILLVRPHGANQEIFKQIKLRNVKVLFRSFEIADTKEAIEEFCLSLKYAICSIGINTSAMIDAVIIGKPVIALRPHEYERTNAIKALHFQYLLKKNIYLQANTIGQAIAHIKRIEKMGNELKKSQNLFIRNYIQPYGLNTSAGEAASDIIESLRMINEKN